MFSNASIYIIVIFVLLAIILFLNNDLLLICLGIAVFVICYAALTEVIRKNEINKYIDELTFNIDVVTKDALLNFRMPLVIIQSDGNIIWKNDNFVNIFQNENLDDKIVDILKTFINKQKATPDSILQIESNIGDRVYDIYANIVKTDRKNRKTSNYILLMYFVDKTDYVHLVDIYDKSNMCVGILSIDNYEELLPTIAEDKRSQLVPTIGKMLRQWLENTNAIVIDKDPSRYIILFQKGYLNELKMQKFSVLEDIKKIDFGTTIPVTLSGGIVVSNDTYIKKYIDAFSTLNIALGRGGDQIVLNEDNKYEFFGGLTAEVEKHTKVKSRIVSQALIKLIQSSKNVIIMGHKDPDVDCIGSGLGLYRLATTLGKEAYIVLDSLGRPLKNLLKKIQSNEKYSTVILNKNEAMSRITGETLLIVVDTHIKNMVEVPELLQETEQVVVIDHHRRSIDSIDNTLLTFQEVYASSTCELVTEILQYSTEDIQLESIEAQALYAGIVVDTKNFTLKSGVRTFESAAFLRKMGVDTLEVNQLFKRDFSTYITIAKIIEDMEIAKEHIGISICPKLDIDQSIVTAQAADEMLNIDNIYASFVLCEENGIIRVSGRSLGKINVQIILEQLGGGGHLSMAGAQLENVTIEQAKQKLIEVIEQLDIKV